MKKISDKAKKYIQDYTKHCSNEITSPYDIVANHLNIYERWLTVDNAESACMIEREEVLREVWNKESFTKKELKGARLKDALHFYNLANELLVLSKEK